MKIRNILIFLIIFCICLTSCEKPPNMTELLAYENEEISFKLHITDEAEFAATLTLGKQSTLLFTDGTLAGIRADFGANGTITLSYEGFHVTVGEASLSKMQGWHTLFKLSEKNLLWKIQKETIGGLALYVCRADDVTVYIDAGTYLPLKITQGKLVIDILESENLSPVEPRE